MSRDAQKCPPECIFQSWSSECKKETNVSQSIGPKIQDHGHIKSPKKLKQLQSPEARVQFGPAQLELEAATKAWVVEPRLLLTILWISLEHVFVLACATGDYKRGEHNHNACVKIAPKVRSVLMGRLCHRQ